jgi:hypothetical protein
VTCCINKALDLRAAVRQIFGPSLRSLFWDSH